MNTGTLAQHLIMENLRINRKRSTLVDIVEEKLIEYFKEQGLHPGSSIPNEAELSASLGIGRTVLREALSRFKMTGMIESRTKRGMVLAEPSILASLSRSINPLLMKEETLRNIFEFRIGLEVGCTYGLFRNITDSDIAELERIVDEKDISDHRHPSSKECLYHEKIYAIIGNNILSEFQTTIMPALDYIMEEHQEEFNRREKEMSDRGELVTHRILLELIKKRDLPGYMDALSRHFFPYTDFLFPAQKGSSPDQ